QVAALPVVDSDRKAAELRQKRDAAQTEFVRYQTELAARYGVPAGEVYPLPRIQAQLPKDAALIAWVELHDQDKRVDRMGDHWACVVRRSGPPVWVRLRGTGQDGAWTDDDDRLVYRVRRFLANRPFDVDGQKSELVQKLVEQRLAPLEKHLQAT